MCYNPRMTYLTGNLFLDIILGFVFLVCVVLLFREVFCWYWKLNSIQKLLEKIEENTRK